MADEVHQDDPTVNMSLDQKITPNTQTVPETFDITVSVVPGHDMVVNHLDGAQELATGNEATAIATLEAEKGENVPLSAVQPQPEEATHRSMPDPETNQPNPAVTPPVDSTPPVVAAAPTPEVSASVSTPTPPAPSKPSQPAQPTSADVQGV